MRFHVISLPHTETTSSHLGCAYTQKVVKFCHMMMSLGHEVFLYGGENNEAECTEFISCVSGPERDWWFGAHDGNACYNPSWDAHSLPWRVMNGRAIMAIRESIQPHDFVCVIAGLAQQPIVDAFPDHHRVEYGIGYEGVCKDTFKVYESQAHMHYVHGTRRDDNGHWYDGVIPNYFDPDDFEFNPTPPDEREDFMFWMGRYVIRKGPQIAQDITENAGLRLILAGQGARIAETGEIIGEEHTQLGKHVVHVGPVDVAQRSRWMREARAVLVPTTYLEPFGGVAVEAMLCGTPIITTDWGAFAEYNHHGVTGYRFRTLAEGVWAARNVGVFQPQVIRDYAVANFSMDVVRWKYDTYFRSLLTLWEGGWYAAADVDPTRYVAGVDAPALNP